MMDKLVSAKFDAELNGSLRIFPLQNFAKFMIDKLISAKFDTELNGSLRTFPSQKCCKIEEVSVVEEEKLNPIKSSKEHFWCKRPSLLKQ